MAETSTAGKQEGFITPTFAVSLLLVVTLIFSAAHLHEAGGRAAEIQEIADAAAISGANVVASYRTVILIVDSVVLSMGLMGVTALALSLVLACIPATHALSVEVANIGRSILDARKTLAEAVTPALQKLEASLPLLVAARSSAVIAANSDEHSRYVGTALAVPFTSATTIEPPADVDQEADESQAARDDVQERTTEMEQLQEQMDEAREKGWLADCGSEPYSMYRRADTLAGLGPSSNPYFESSDTWDFPHGLTRARAYYRARVSQEAPQAAGDEELARSVARKAFYDYASDQLVDATVMDVDGNGVCTVPYLPKNTDEIAATHLYTDPDYPVTLLDGAPTLHASASCSSATGDVIAHGSVADVDAGTYHECPTCGFTVKTLGFTPQASTNIENGFEYHLRAFTDAAYEYAAARVAYDILEEEAQQAAEAGVDAFDRALEILSVPRVGLAPPGRAGCVAIVTVAERSSSQRVDTTFVSGVPMSRGVAVSGAALATTDGSEDSTIIADFVTRAGDEYAKGSIGSGVADTLMEAWSALLTGYGDGIESTASALDTVLRFGGDENELSRWVADVMDETLRAAGFAPVDLRVVKPVLVNTADIYDEAGLDSLVMTKEVVARLPSTTEESDAAALVSSISGITTALGGSTVIELGEFTLPGTDISIPLSVDLAELEEAA